MNICHFAHHFVRVLFKHEQYIIYSQTISQTQLDDIAHEQTIIFRQSFAGHVLGSRPMKRKKNLHRMIKFLINRQQTHAKRGHPTTQCLQIRQKWLKWDFFVCFSGLFGTFGAALKTIYLFRCLKGTMVVSKVFGGFFVSFETNWE